MKKVTILPHLTVRLSAHRKRDITGTVTKFSGYANNRKPTIMNMFTQYKQQHQVTRPHAASLKR